MASTNTALRSAYGKLVAATWSQPHLAEELKKSPEKLLKEYGFPAAKAGAKFDIQVVPTTGEGSFQSQDAAWVLGEKTGHYTIWLPQKPKGIDDVRAMDGCTTCTPCCTCT